MKTEKHGRYWAVYDDDGGLICIAAYLRGARELVRKLQLARLVNIPAGSAAADKAETLGGYYNNETQKV